MAYIRPRNSRENVEKLFAIFGEHKLNFPPGECVMLNQIDEGES